VAAGAGQEEGVTVRRLRELNALPDRPRQTERDFQRAVIELAHLLRWRVAHFRPAQNSKGVWRTPVAADGAGFPDLVLLRGTRAIVAELKSEPGRVRPEQQAWLDSFNAASVAAYLWRPRDWPTIEAVLR